MCVCAARDTHFPERPSRHFAVQNLQADVCTLTMGLLAAAGLRVLLSVLLYLSVPLFHPHAFPLATNLEQASVS